MVIVRRLQTKVTRLCTCHHIEIMCERVYACVSVYVSCPVYSAPLYLCLRELREWDDL